MKVFQPEDDDTCSISDRGIVTIYEDKNKTLWIGTLGGLNKLNRADESFKYYKHIPGESNSIISDSIQCIYEDKQGRLWIGTNRGLNLFDKENEIFIRYYFTTEDLKSSDNSLSKQSCLGINAIIGDPVSNNLLIGTDKDGLWKFDINEKGFSKYKFSSVQNFDKNIGWIQSFYKSRDGKIWMASDHTLSNIDPSNSRFKLYTEFPKLKDNIYESPCYTYGSVIEDQSGLIWFGFVAYDNGVFCLNQKAGQIRHYKLSPNAPKNSYDNMIFDLYESRSGIIWIGTLDRGLWKLDKRKNNFQLLKHDAENSNSISNSKVYDIVSDPKGYVWISTQTALDKYDIKEDKFIHYLKNEEFLTHNRYRTTLDKTGNIWIGSDYGLLKFNPASSSYQIYFNDHNILPSLINKSIFHMLQDHLGFLWIATIQSGLYKYDIAKNKLTQYKHDPMDSSSIKGDQIRGIYEDRAGTIWIGTNYYGLNKFNRETEKFTYCGFKCVAPVYEDKHGNFWVADYFTGLNLFDRSTNRITANYNQKKGLPYTEIIQFIEDDSDNLWLGTRNGLSKFNIKTRTFKNYFKEDGLPDNFFLSNNAARGSDGRIYFSTTGGLLAFYPDSIKDDPTPAQVVISKVSLINKPGKKLKYKGFISENEEIIIPYDENDLRFDFIGLHFSEPSKNKYKYILENFDKNWIDAGTQRNATYTNLVPGEYIFRVTASNRDGIWNEKGASIKIIITSPWWQTNVAFIFYALIIIGTIYIAWKTQLKRVKIKHDYEMSKFEAEKHFELDEMKSRFFTNISHEFRTPLTLILGPAKQILKQTKNDKIKEDADIIYRSAKKLNRLANQLLDISSIEAGKMELKTSPQNLIPVVKEIISSFQAFAEWKKISLTFDPEQEEIIIYLDRDKIDKIFSNILSNALKFTPQGGSVDIKVLQPALKSMFPPLERQGMDQNELTTNNFIEISINDTGIGIPKEQLDKIFDRFYQVDNRLSKEYEGTGVGLSLTKELVELHKGKIYVESEEGKGSIFKIILPLGKEHLLPEEIVVKSQDEEVETGEEKKLMPAFNESILFPNLTFKKNGYESIDKEEKPLLLIVEDNRDVRNYIIDILDNYYIITEASNGEEGLCKSFNEIPDLIISDIMMPKLDGIQLCNKLKSDSRTSHIPLILLTAKATLKDKIEGLQIGADDYIMKPFEADELKTRIKNLLDQRKRIHEHFQKNGLFEIEESSINSVDQRFLHKTVEIINKHISDPCFSVEKLAEDLAVSRSLLHKKLNSLIGESPGDLLKRTRLNKAAKLIEHNSGNITEIAFEVGFNDPSYFTACFKKQFGVSPSHYHKATN